MQEANYTIDQAGVRTRAIERQLINVQELPTSEKHLKIENEINSEAIDIKDNIENRLFNETETQ